MRALECREVAVLTPGEGAATVQRLISSDHTPPSLSRMRTQSRSGRVPAELDIECGYQSTIDETSPRAPRRHTPTPRVAATVETGSNPA